MIPHEWHSESDPRPYFKCHLGLSFSPRSLPQRVTWEYYFVFFPTFLKQHLFFSSPQATVLTCHWPHVIKVKKNYWPSVPSLSLIGELHWTLSLLHERQKEKQVLCFLVLIASHHISSNVIIYNIEMTKEQVRKSCSDKVSDMSM